MLTDFSIPAYLFDFSTLDDLRTIAKLKVFYVGETGDGRVFDEDFSQELVKSVAYTPVIAYYSDLKQDFIGHNTKQYIYGIVRPDADYGFETDEDGTKWFITEVMLYTDRIDNIGEIAKKIVGHKQSLEMDPNSVEYEVFKEGGKSKVRFTKARLCGLSVLGDDQQPAFDGSEFFAENDDLKERFENFFSFLTNKDRGALMDKKTIIENYVNFIKLTYNEKQKQIMNYINAELGGDYYTAVCDMTDTDVIIYAFNYYTGETTYTKYAYTIDEQGVTLSEGQACFVRYLTASEIDALDSFSKATDNKQEEEKEENCEEKKEEEDKEEDKEVDKKKEEEDEDKEEKNFETTEPSQIEDCTNSEVEETFTNVEGEQHDQVQQLQNEENEEVQENFTASAPELTNSEREELETYRLQAKMSLIDSYKDDLSADTISSFKEMAKETSYDELEAKLAIEFRKVSKENNKTNAAVFSFNNVVTAQANTPTSYADLVKATLNK